MTDDHDDNFEWPDPADKAYAVEQAKRLRDQVVKGGLRFEAYLASRHESSESVRLLGTYPELRSV